MELATSILMDFERLVGERFRLSKNILTSKVEEPLAYGVLPDPACQFFGIDRPDGTAAYVLGVHVSTQRDPIWRLTDYWVKKVEESFRTRWAVVLLNGSSEKGHFIPWSDVAKIKPEPYRHHGFIEIRNRHLRDAACSFLGKSELFSLISSRSGL